MCRLPATIGQHPAVSGGLARSPAGVSIQSTEDGGGGPWAHRLHRERVGREAGVDPRLLIDYFLRESLGLTNIVKAVRSAPGLRGLRPVLKEGEPWRKDHSQARLRLRRALSAR
jgi:hypothetical protein